MGLSKRPCLIISSRFCTSSFTLSMGAAAVLETPAATPESMKLSKNPNFFSAIVVFDAREVELAVFFFFLRQHFAASFLAAMAAALSYSSAWFSLFSSTMVMPCSSSRMVGSRVELQWLEEELEELSVGGGMGRSTVG